MNTVHITVVAFTEHNSEEGFVKADEDFHGVLLALDIEGDYLGCVRHCVGPGVGGGRQQGRRGRGAISRLVHGLRLLSRWGFGCRRGRGRRPVVDAATVLVIAELGRLTMRAGVSSVGVGARRCR